MVALFEREDWELFGSLATLAQKAGVPQRDLVAVAAKELADNALDAGACVDVGLCAPDGFYVTDDGPGLPVSEPGEIARLFSIGRPLVSSKLWRLPTRGALGNGLRVVAGLVLATGGRLTVTTHGQILELTPRTDGLTDYEVVGTSSDAGTRVEVHLGAGNSVTRDDLLWAGLATVFASGTSYKGKSSPHWYDVESFSTLLRAAGQRPVRELLAELDGCSGGKAGQIAASFKGRPARSLSRDEAERLLAQARLAARPVVPTRLGVIGAQEVLGDAYAVATGAFPLPPAGGTLRATIPFVAEVWMESIPPHMRDPDGEEAAERGGKAGDRWGIPCHLCVNKTPVTQATTARYDAKDKKVVIHCGADYIFAKVGRMPPQAIWINVQTPYMPITSDGKSPDLRYVRDVITAAAEKAGRQIARACPPAGRTGGGQTGKGITFAHLADGIAKVSTDGQHRFAQRQLFYVIRPFLARELGKEPDYDVFAGYLMDYETEHGPIPGMYRDTRGTIYHPHTGEEIAVGTLSVEDYTRPPLTFNKLVYIEKEGLFSVLKAEQWPERHDCALITSKGHASRAAKDLIDLLVATSATGDDETLEVYCIHDADAAGTMIYQALQEETRTRPGRRVKIHNLGLDPWEAVALGLAVETVTYKKRQPVADYIKEHGGGDGVNWVGWLQTHRIELNAMDTETLLRWLDGKMADHARGKVVPPHTTIAAHLREGVRQELEATITERVIAEANIPQQVDAAFAALSSDIAAMERRDLPALVASDLADDPRQLWRAPVAHLARRVCRMADAGNTAAE